jgi:hypothetical protein
MAAGLIGTEGFDPFPSPRTSWRSGYRVSGRWQCGTEGVASYLISESGDSLFQQADFFVRLLESKGYRAPRSQSRALRVRQIQVFRILEWTR